MSIIWTINITTFAYILIGPIIPFLLIYHLLRMAFWGSIYLFLFPLTTTAKDSHTDKPFLPIENQYFLYAVRTLANTTANILTFIPTVIHLLAGQQPNQFLAPVCAQHASIKGESTACFLARLDIALSAGNIYRHTYNLTGLVLKLILEGMERASVLLKSTARSINIIQNSNDVSEITSDYTTDDGAVEQMIQMPAKIAIYSTVPGQQGDNIGEESSESPSDTESSDEQEGNGDSGEASDAGDYTGDDADAEDDDTEDVDEISIDTESDL